MKKFIALFIVAVMLALVLCACGNATKVSGDSYYSERNDGGYSTTVSSMDYDIFDESKVQPDETVTEIKQKLIKRYNLSLETLEYDKAKQQLDSLTNVYGGYFSSSSESKGSLRYENSYSARTGNFTIRVPSEKLEEFVEKISEGCNVMSSTLVTDDVTESYYSMQSRIDALALQEERILAMMEKADDLKYLIQLEDKLTEIRSQINEINYQLKYYDKSVDYSYVFVNLQEVKQYQQVEEPTFFSRLGEAISETFVVFGEFLGEILIIIVWVLPFMIFGGIIAIIVVVCIRKDKKKKLAKNKDENTQIK